MPFFTYIIHSESHGGYYKGYTDNPERRIWEHNNNLSRYTAYKGPWNLVYLKKHTTKRDALIEERKPKHAGSEYLQRIIEEYSRSAG